MPSFSSLMRTVPKLCGQACVLLVDGLWFGCGYFAKLFHNRTTHHIKLWKSPVLTQRLRTNCTHNSTVAVYNFTPVFNHFYTVFTGPTNITTTFI